MDVARRAEAIRTRGRTGTWDDLPALIDTARTEKSPSLRLLAGVAVNDILVRLRGELTDAQRDLLVGWVGSLDPGTNPALLLALAPAETRALDRIGRMLRDGRTEVRTGATAVVRRMLLSRWCREPDAIAGQVRSWLAGRLAPDAAADLIRLVGEAGLAPLRAVVSQVPSTGKSHGELLDECLGRLNRVDQDGWWVPDGRDVLEEAEERLDPANSVWIGGDVVLGRADRAGLRLVFAQRAGEADRSAALLGDGLVRWRVEQPGKVVEAAADALPPAIAERLIPVLEPRARGLARFRAGQLEAAVADLTEATTEKRPRPETWLWLARAHARLGRSAEAASAAREYLERAAKKAPGRPEAEALAGG